MTFILSQDGKFTLCQYIQYTVARAKGSKVKRRYIYHSATKSEVIPATNCLSTFNLNTLQYAHFYKILVALTALQFIASQEL